MRHSDQCEIVLRANLANLGPYPFGRTLWKEGSSTGQDTCEYRAGDPFGIVSNQPTVLLAKSQGRSQYVVQFRDDRRDSGAHTRRVLRRVLQQFSCTTGPIS